MKILTAQQTREADAYTIENEPVASIDLMERASRQCFEWIKDHFPNHTPVTVFAGVGNNGGDGLAIARMLQEANYSVQVYIVHFSDQHTRDFDTNLSRLTEVGVHPVVLSEADHQFELNKDQLVIDAIFGSGLSRPISGFIAGIVKTINASASQVIAIDMPSGLFSESNRGNDGDSIIQATYTLTFQQPKLAMLFPEHEPYVGVFNVLDIGLSQSFIETLATNYFYTDRSLAKSMLHRRSKFSHKGSYGHALLICGSQGKMGAAILSATACLRTGVGLLTMHVPKSGVEIMQTAVPEAMCLIDEHDERFTRTPDLSKFDAVGVGPGLGTATDSQQALKFTIQNAETSMIVDADALNILSENPTWLSFLPEGSILTPHPKEFGRLVGKWSDDEERLQLQKDLAVKHGLVVVLKGANTSVAMPDGSVYFNSTGNPGMATGGSGDVLTGMITSLLAQGYESHEAAILGVYLHGLTGDLALDREGENALIASDLVHNIAGAYRVLEKS
ncbi:MAG: NAD(P)H-hydrate dehydratase [Flavobacteriales bacterium]|nr:NAD(P)H-hydrate dehydratase [Flavobacteriales bacterium]